MSEQHAGERVAGKRPRTRTTTNRPPNTSPRLQEYLARTQTALDLLALLTLWIVVIPLRHLGVGEDLTVGGIVIRLAVSAVYGIDLAIRARLAPRHLEYVRTHPIGVLAVLMPPIRVIFSLRLITSLFRRGHITRFLIAAGILLINGAIIVYFYEYSAPGANITSPWISIWWAIVTVATVGYGDFYPVTVPGRIVASFIMAIGILTLAVITAQVSSSFVDQSRKRRLSAEAAAADPASAAAAGSPPSAPDATADADGVVGDRLRVDPPLQSHHIDALHARLERIEAHLAQIVRSEDDSRPDSTSNPGNSDT